MGILIGSQASEDRFGPGGVLEPAKQARLEQLGLPVIAIGGVTPERARELAGAGAYGVAVIRAIWDAADPRGAARSLLEAVG